MSTIISEFCSKWRHLCTTRVIYLQKNSY